MKNIYILLTAASLAVVLFSSSCKKVLEKQPETTLTPAEVFSDSLVTVFYLNTIYTNNLPTWAGNTGGAIGSVGPGSLTEENSGGSPYTTGSVTMETVGDIGTANSNSNTYAKIRNINDFITGMQTSPIATPIKTRFIAQALFFRALRYFELVKIYGGVPVETGTLGVVGMAAKVADDLPRNTTTQTWTQIIADLDTAIKGLPAVWPNSADYGRITKGAAQAYLGRVLNYWASPQFNTTNDVTRWQAALAVCNAAITTLSGAGYGLYPKEDVTMWTTEGGSGGVPSNIEAVMVTEYNSANSISDPQASNNGYTQAGIPKALFGSGGNNPTWTEVQAFPMSDGCPINATVATCPGKTQTYNPNLYFDNRDPRFAQTIAYNGCLWPLEGNTLNRVWTYYYYTKANSTAITTTESSGASGTGFYCRKAIDPNITASNLPYSGTDWIEIRYAEVILNRAEAAAQTGDLTTAYGDLEAIRKRAGITAGTNGYYGLVPGMTQAQMISAILYERQIEFAYEGKRYWDLRRYMLLESTLNGTYRQSLVTSLNVNTSSYTDYILTTRDGLASANGLDYVYNNYFTSSTVGGVVIPALAPKNLDTTPIAYQTADYFFGIPTASIQSDPNLLQNTTWGGPFNPLL